MLSIKKITLATALVAAFSLTACLQGEQGEKETATTNIRIRASVASIFASGSSLAKGNTISYSKLAITLISNSNTPTASDTIRDTIRAGVSQGFVANSAIDQTIDSNYTLKALRNWKVRVSVIDSKNIVTHDTTIIPAANNYVRIGDTVSIVIGALAPKYTQYRAIFTGLPDSVTTSATTLKQGVRFTKLVVRIDGVIVRDSAGTPNFNGLPIDTLDYDYVTTGLHTVRLAAYGMLLNAAGVALITDTLFVGQDTLTAGPGIDVIRPIVLAWTNKGNNQGNEKITVTIGKVGRATVNGSTNGVNVVPKRK